jgi:hypothetical protein
MPATTTMSTGTNCAADAMTLRLAEPQASLLDSLLGLMRDDRSNLPELLDRLVEIRGLQGALIDLIDGLMLAAEADDSPPEDCDASRALLESLRGEVFMRTEHA